MVLPEILDELKAEIQDDFIAEHKQKLIKEAKIATDSEIKKVKDNANERLKESLVLIEDKIDVALAEKANSSIIKDIAVKKGLTGGIVLSRITKDKALTVAQVESALELAKNQRNHELRCNKKVDKAQGEVSSMKKELEKQQDIAKKATHAWNDTIKILDGNTLNGIKIFTHENIASTVKYLRD